MGGMGKLEEGKQLFPYAVEIFMTKFRLFSAYALWAAMSQSVQRLATGW